MRANAWEEIGKELKIKCKTWREDSVSPALLFHERRSLVFYPVWGNSIFMLPASVICLVFCHNLMWNTCSLEIIIIELKFIFHINCGLLYC
jgi:hypothetical protein